MTGMFFLGADQDPKFELREMDFPPLAPHQVLVENKACGVCGTDVHIYNGEPGSAEVTPPVVLGHEYSGIVRAVGDAVTTVKPGDHVALDPNMYCGICRPCRMGKKQNCQHLLALGVNTDGGFAEYSLCPESQCFLMDPSVDFDVAAMVEPLACAIHGMDKAGIVSGQSVLIVGGGTIGQIMLQLALLQGAAQVILSEPVEERRRIGLELGATAAIDPIQEDLNARIREITGEDGADVVIECVGKAFAVEQAIAAAGQGSTVLLFSVPNVDARIDLPLFPIFSKELTIVGSRINPDTHQRAANLINAGKIQLKKLITHVYDMAHLEDAILRQMDSSSIKVIVRPHLDT